MHGEFRRIIYSAHQPKHTHKTPSHYNI